METELNACLQNEIFASKETQIFLIINEPRSRFFYGFSFVCVGVRVLMVH